MSDDELEMIATSADENAEAPAPRVSRKKASKAAKATKAAKTAKTAKTPSKAAKKPPKAAKKPSKAAKRVSVESDGEDEEDETGSDASSVEDEPDSPTPRKKTKAKKTKAKKTKSKKSKASRKRPKPKQTYDDSEEDDSEGDGFTDIPTEPVSKEADMDAMIAAVLQPLRKNEAWRIGFRHTNVLKNYITTLRFCAINLRLVIKKTPEFSGAVIYQHGTEQFLFIIAHIEGIVQIAPELGDEVEVTIDLNRVHHTVDMLRRTEHLEMFQVKGDPRVFFQPFNIMTRESGMLTIVDTYMVDIPRSKAIPNSMYDYTVEMDVARFHLCMKHGNSIKADWVVVKLMAHKPSGACVLEFRFDGTGQSMAMRIAGPTMDGNKEEPALDHFKQKKFMRTLDANPSGLPEDLMTIPDGDLETFYNEQVSLAYLHNFTQAMTKNNTMWIRLTSGQALNIHMPEAAEQTYLTFILAQRTDTDEDDSAGAGAGGH